MSTTRALNVLIVHGIGWGNRGTLYARPLEDSIRHAFDRAIGRLHLRDIDGKDARAKNALRFEAACWDPITQKPQDSLLSVMFGGLQFFRRATLTYHFRRNMVSLLGDVIAYERNPNNHVYQAIHKELEDCISRLSEASAGERDENGYAPLTIIGHSLGSVIGSDFVWDHAEGSGSHRLGDHHFSLHNFVSMGSPMALYALRDNTYGDRESIRESLKAPIQVEPEHGFWLNLYDRQDAIAFPLQPIESYQDVGVIDCAINAGTWLTGWNFISHIGYWRCDEASQIIGRKLALDWARLNSPRFAGRDYNKALDALRKELRHYGR